MSVASMHSAEFFEKVARGGRVYTFLSEGRFLVFPVNGKEVVPFWSSRSRLERVQALHPKYRAWQMDGLDLDHFLDVTLPELQHGGIRIGINWAGKDLIGYDRDVADVERNLAYWMARLAPPVHAPEEAHAAG